MTPPPAPPPPVPRREPGTCCCRDGDRPRRVGTAEPVGQSSAEPGPGRGIAGCRLPAAPGGDGASRATPRLWSPRGNRARHRRPRQVVPAGTGGTAARPIPRLQPKCPSSTFVRSSSWAARRRRNNTSTSRGI